MGYLDGDGLKRFWAKIKSILGQKQNILSAGRGISIENDTVSLSETYVSNETRIGTWIDGKPIYRQVLSFKTTSNDTSGANITIPGGVTVETLVRLDGFIATSNGTYMTANSSDEYWYADNPSGTSAFILCVGYTRRTVYLLSRGPDSHSRPVTVIIEYTKTTDVAPVSLLTAEPNASIAPAHTTSSVGSLAKS